MKVTKSRTMDDLPVTNDELPDLLAFSAHDVLQQWDSETYQSIQEFLNADGGPEASSGLKQTADEAHQPSPFGTTTTSGSFEISSDVTNGGAPSSVEPVLLHGFGVGPPLHGSDPAVSAVMDPSFNSFAQPVGNQQDFFNFQNKPQEPPYVDNGQYYGQYNNGYYYNGVQTPMCNQNPSIPSTPATPHQQYVPAGPSSSLCDDPISPTETLYAPIEMPQRENDARLWQEEILPEVALSAPSIKPAPVVVLPNLTDWPGLYNFHVALGDRKSGWTFSDKTKKLYIELGKELKLVINFNTSGEDLVLRVMPAFTTADLCDKSIVRCAVHRIPTEETNRNFPYPEHVVRLAGRYEQQGTYVRDQSSGHFSVMTTAQCPYNRVHLQDVSIKFMCLGTCSIDGSGERKRATREIGTIFTLERPGGEVVGRSVIRVRVCRCPARDKTADEKKAGEEGPAKKQKAKKRKIELDSDSDQLPPPAQSGKRACRPGFLVYGSLKTDMEALFRLVAGRK